VTITNGYATLQQAQAELQIDDSADATRIEICIAAASRQVDSYTGRRFWQDGTVTDRQFHADNSMICYVDDISTTTGLVVKVDTADNGFVSGTTTLTVTTDFVLRPTNAADDVPVRPYTMIVLTSDAAASFPVSSSRPGVQVTATVGWPAVPDDVVKACLLQTAQLFRGADAPFGVASFGLDGGAMRLRESLHPLAAAILQPYVKL
jgi:hypothetical protein